MKRKSKKGVGNIMDFYTTTAKKEQLAGLFDTVKLAGNDFKVTVLPISEAEADEIEFKSLKGIANRWLDVDEVRRERLGL